MTMPPPITMWFAQTSATTDSFLVWWMAAAVVICGFALLLSLVNLRRFSVAPSPAGDDVGWSLSVCIPARNEAANLEDCVRAVLRAADADAGSQTTVLVYDDGSDDETPVILARLAAEDPRVRAAETKPLPPGWNGKQHACDSMGRQATSDWLLLIDADVRLAPDALVRTRAASRRRSGSNPEPALLSAFPRERTDGLGEAMVIPLIHFILMSYLPFGRMRNTLDPAASAACGQYMLVRRDAWNEIGGHASIRASMHDGVLLPRMFRRGGHATDVFDATDIVECRMYDGFAATWSGFVKNAYEGLGNVLLLLLLTVLHLGGHVAPWCVAVIGGLDLLGGDGTAVSTPAIVLAVAAIGLQLVQRSVIAGRFRQDRRVIALHAPSLVLLTAIQWWSLVMHLTGRRSWRGRTA
ncbi:MAG: glycosyltransferase family 2 protein [Phycisphaerales bacterium]|nr:glycosyltransferase family 2 protein [Phycisphaerales bacterium]